MVKISVSDPIFIESGSGKKSETGFGQICIPNQNVYELFIGTKNIILRFFCQKKSNLLMHFLNNFFSLMFKKLFCGDISMLIFFKDPGYGSETPFYDHLRPF